LGNKVICPLCEQEGYLVFENRQKKSKPTKRDIWKKRDQYPELTDKEFAARIAQSRNILKKDYPVRVRHPYASIIHKVKKNGKWKNVPHYLGKITKIDSNLEKLGKTLDSKISDKVWQAFIESIDNARYNQFKNLDTPTKQIIAEIIALRKIPYVRFHDNIEHQQDNPYHCPHCNEVIELVIRGYKISIKTIDTRHSF